MTHALAVEVRGLVKRFGDRVTAVDALDLSVRPGEIYGPLGPNGAGRPLRDVFVELTGSRTGGADSLRRPGGAARRRRGRADG